MTAARFILLLVFAVDWLLLTYLALRPATDSIGIHHFDKVMHFIAYAQLTVFAFIVTAGKHSLRHFYSFCAAIVIYGIAIEIIQLFIEGRDGSVYDFIANSIGVIIGYALVKLYLARRHPRQLPKSR